MNTTKTETLQSKQAYELLHIANNVIGNWRWSSLLGCPELLEQGSFAGFLHEHVPQKRAGGRALLHKTQQQPMSRHASDNTCEACLEWIFDEAHANELLELLRPHVTLPMGFT